MGRGRKSTPWWDANKKAWYTTVRGKRYPLGKERPDGWSDEAWINFSVISIDLKFGEVNVTVPPDYSATPQFVISCMPARGRQALGISRCKRVAQKLEEMYGPNASTLMDADVTGEVDWEGEPVLRGLAWDIVQITRELYEQDRHVTGQLFPHSERERLPRLSPRSCGYRLGRTPGTGSDTYSGEGDDPRHARPRYVDRGETAKADPPEKRKARLLDPVPGGDVDRQEKHEILRRLERIAVTAEEKALERQDKIRGGQIQVTSLGDVRTVAFPRWCTGSLLPGLPPRPDDEHKPTEQEKITAQMEEYRERDRLARQRARRRQGRVWNRNLTREEIWTPRLDEPRPD
jgi:hypothetical protein